jgi:anti-anti-sigma factor
MEILESATPEGAVVHVTGNVNSSNAAILGEKLKQTLHAGSRSVVLDFSRLGHMTSAGFRLLLQAEMQCQATGGKLVMYGLHGLTLELFEIGGFLEMFTVAASREEALGLAAGRAGV